MSDNKISTVPAWLLKKSFKYPTKLEIFIGEKQAIEVRISGWNEIKKENLILIAPEATLNLPLPKSVLARKKAVNEDKIKTRFIENINSPQSLEKNLKRLEQGIEVRYLDHHGYSMSIRDESIVVLEFPFPIDDLINFKIYDKNLAKSLKIFFNDLWKKAKPLTPALVKKFKLLWKQN